jgi:hypothetical protein
MEIRNRKLRSLWEVPLEAGYGAGGLLSSTTGNLYRANRFNEMART